MIWGSTAKKRAWPVEINRLNPSRQFESRCTQSTLLSQLDVLGLSESNGSINQVRLQEPHCSSFIRWSPLSHLGFLEMAIKLLQLERLCQASAVARLVPLIVSFTEYLFQGYSSLFGTSYMLFFFWISVAFIIIIYVFCITVDWFHMIYFLCNVWAHFQMCAWIKLLFYEETNLNSLYAFLSHVNMNWHLEPILFLHCVIFQSHSTIRFR